MSRVPRCRLGRRVVGYRPHFDFAPLRRDVRCFPREPLFGSVREGARAIFPISASYRGATTTQARRRFEPLLWLRVKKSPWKMTFLSIFGVATASPADQDDREKRLDLFNGSGFSSIP